MRTIRRAETDDNKDSNHLQEGNTAALVSPPPMRNAATTSKKATRPGHRDPKCLVQDVLLHNTATTSTPTRHRDPQPPGHRDLQCRGPPAVDVRLHDAATTSKKAWR